jgi:phosphonate transport system substrate-binding protein
MKKLLTVLLCGLMAVSLAACSNTETTVDETDTPDATEETMKIDKLVVYFVPSREPDEIITATEPLKVLLSNELAAMGYEVGEVDIQVGTTYEAVGEALSAGSADVGFIPGGTYTLYDDGCDVILTATRAGLSKDSSDAIDWNDGMPTEAAENQVTYYKGLIIAGPSETGRALAAKVNAGEDLTWEDVSSAKWGVRSVTSSSGYIYPSLWLTDNFESSITDLPDYVQTDSYGSSFARLASMQVDVITVYADARRDNDTKWMEDLARENEIWAETDVIGVTSNVYNDTISVRKDMDAGLKAALSDAFINIANTDEGKEVISIYSHEGYQVATSADYDAERAAQQLMNEASE